MMGYGNWGMSGFGWLGMVFFTLLILLVIVFLVRNLDGISFQRPQRDSALELARERLAKGEINQEEFETLQRALKTG